nr:MAG TPA: hypothetical protein [Bacteriophage sp.]
MAIGCLDRIRLPIKAPAGTLGSIGRHPSNFLHTYKSPF